MIKAVTIGFSCFILFLILHVIVFRTIELKERFRALTVIFYSLFPAYIIAYLFAPSGYTVIEVAGPAFLSFEAAYRVTAAIQFVSGLMLYIFLFLGYCQFYFIVDRSISMRVMIEIENSPEKRLSFDEIRAVYPFDEIFERRLGHMVEGRYVVNESGYYVNTRKGRIEARIFMFLKELLRLGKGG